MATDISPQHIIMDHPGIRTNDNVANVNSNIDEAYAAEHDNFDDDEPMLPTTQLKHNTLIRGSSLTLRILYLTLSLAGLQFTWSVEMAYGTPYLLSLGLSKSHMSLVWIAGPLSGLIMQPIVGAFSDKCTSRWGRRRPFLVAGSLMVVTSLIVIGWTREITMIFVDDQAMATFKKVSIGIAIASIYVLDFSINCVQASCRALIVDSLPPSQQEKGTAWAGRMLGLGNVMGYFMGYVDLVKLFPFLGNTQLKVLCVFASIILLLCDVITCYTVKEKILSKDSDSKNNESHLKTFKDIGANLWNLPLTIRQICNVQFFAWIGWFPFLFYSTTWVAEIYDKTALQHQPSNNQDTTIDTVGQATRAGSLAFLVYSLVSLVASFFIPLLVKPSTPSSPHNNTYYDDERGFVEFSIRGKRMIISMSKYAQCIQCLTLPRMWTLSHFIFCLAMLSTALVYDVVAASLVIGICGLSWAVTMWAPFSLLGEYISQYEQQQQHYEEQQERPLGMQQQHSSRISLAAGGAGMGTSGGIYQIVEQSENSRTSLVDGSDDYIQMQEYKHMDTPHQQQQQVEQHTPSPTLSTPLHQRSPTLHDTELPTFTSSPAIDTTTSIPSAGIILGIHNMYIVLPQFLVTFFSSVLFHFLENGDQDAPSDAIGVVLRFGAVMAAIAGLLSLKLDRKR
ncbi:major facilitator superfamily domain-containing protein [Absidia repens]|uniref:Major facilitator superfamily domain-containing protein n=1 Tax=Absidia repens TaxID=90262 RepID=A0A1X2IWB7_9FUNG|nr:major facilitator superfamily domain-containing protein [Absidia repens]